MASEVTRLDVEITAPAWPYLQVQRGAISDKIGDPKAWKVAYEADLLADWRSIAPALPADVAHICDIGGGMSGISIYLSARYADPLAVEPPGGRWPTVTVVDSFDAPATVVKHDQPFSSSFAMTEFLRVNHVRGAITALKPAFCLDPVSHDQAPLFDVIISFQAWPFHIRHDEYLKFAERRLAPHGVLICDVRAGDGAAIHKLTKAFGEPRLLRAAPKYRRVAFGG
jgi:hypothetical protein